MVGVKPSSNENELEALHRKSCLIIIIEEEETLQEVEEVEVEVQELPIVAINVISHGIDRLSV